MSSFGNHLKISLFGESHGPAIGVVMENLAPGIELDLALIQEQLKRRRPKGSISTQRRETDAFEIVSGFFNGRTTGTPLCILIRNQSQHSKDYEATKSLLRPSHADYTAYEKYRGFQDYRGGGHFSGRLTAPLVAAGAVCLGVLQKKGVCICSHILNCNGILDTPFSEEEGELRAQMDGLSGRAFPTLSDAAGQEMMERIHQARSQKDSVGGVIQTAVVGLPAGIGEPFFDSIESVLSHLFFSIPAVKGVEFGLGFGFATCRGSEANDPFYWDDGIKTRTNHNAGINGGISNGMPVLIQSVVKPTPSIYQPQHTVDYATGEEVTLTIEGRHDPAILHRAVPVFDAMAAIGLYDLFCGRYGYLWMGEEP